MQLAANICMATLEADKDNKIIMRNRLEPVIENITLTGAQEPFSDVAHLQSSDAVMEYALMGTEFLCAGRFAAIQAGKRLYEHGRCVERVVC